MVERLVNTARYPLTESGNASWRAIVRAARAELRADGCTVLPDFISPELIGTLRQECAEIAPRAYYETETVNVYNTEPEQGLPDGHPARTAMQRGNAFVAWQDIPREAILNRLYVDPAFHRLIAACFELPTVYPLADPFAGLCLNIVRPGKSHPWHFDTNEFAISMLTQAGESGGEFEYCPNIRSASAENFDEVRAVLTGRADHLIRVLAPRPGDLQLFRGRYSLHRVRTVRGNTARHAAIFAFSERPGVLGSVARTKQLFGRVTEEHLAADRRVRVDRLLD